MARRRKRHTSRRRHARVGAFSLKKSDSLVLIGSAAVGYLGGTQINSMVNMLIPASMKTQPNTGKMVAAAQAGLGALLVFMKGKKSMLKSVAGGLLLGSGIKRATVVFAPNTTDTLGGYGDIPVIGAYAPNSSVGRKRVAGYGDVPVIGAYAPNSSVGSGSKVMGNCEPSSSGYNNGSAGASAYME